MTWIFQLYVTECERAINSIELQLLRIETCGSADVNIREGKINRDEIQSKWLH